MMVGEIINAMAGQELQTPIEIALGIDEKGMTTAKRLYEFLELNPRNYARWCKSNITGNEFAERDIDYYSSSMKSEGKGNFAEDFKLTAHFAKKLSMKGSGERAEQAREYFTRLDEKMKEIAVDQSKLSPLLQLLISMELKQRQQERKIRELEILMGQQDGEIRDLENRIGQQDSGTSQRQQDAAPKKTRNELTDAERDARQWALRSIGRIAESHFFKGIYNRYQQVYLESYDRLERMADCDLSELVAEAKEKAKREGASKTKIKNISRQTVIAGDPMLRKKYESVIRDMLLVYCGEIVNF